jgi:arginine decarboxylase
VLQALVEPGDMVLIDRDCHKSHHYGLVLTGAFPVYLDSYPLPEFSMYGAVPLEHIREKLLELKKAGRLHHVKMLLLTNCTFDGVVYNVQRVMEEVLAIKPDIVFLWDEAWFAFAASATSSSSAPPCSAPRALHRKYHSDAYRAEYDAHIKASLKEGEDAAPARPRQGAHPRVRHAEHAQDAHLAAAGQHDPHLGRGLQRRRARTASTRPTWRTPAPAPTTRSSPAWTWAGARWSSKAMSWWRRPSNKACCCAHKINEHPKLRRWFDIITSDELVPAQYRQSGLNEYYSKDKGWNRDRGGMGQRRVRGGPHQDQPVHGQDRVDGDTFKNQYLMDKHPSR